MNADAAHTTDPTSAPSPSPRRGPLARVVAAIALALIALYRAALAPLMAGHCRFHPTCSHYAEQAFRTHPPHRAAWLSLRRVLRCHPLGGHGHDPVPPPRTRHRHI
jgi:putative membrane protein insertion efficiency factor